MGSRFIQLSASRSSCFQHVRIPCRCSCNAPRSRDLCFRSSLCWLVWSTHVSLLVVLGAGENGCGKRGLLGFQFSLSFVSLALQLSSLSLPGLLPPICFPLVLLPLPLTSKLLLSFLKLEPFSLQLFLLGLHELCVRRFLLTESALHVRLGQAPHCQERLLCKPPGLASFSSNASSLHLPLFLQVLESLGHFLKFSRQCRCWGRGLVRSPFHVYVHVNGSLAWHRTGLSVRRNDACCTGGASLPHRCPACLQALHISTLRARAVACFRHMVGGGIHARSRSRSTLLGLDCWLSRCV